MPRPNADRNLLIGVLALQMDFIDRDQLVAVMQAWITEKSRSLDQLLLEHNALSEDTRLLLVALVDKHLEMHGGDVERSLAAASSLRSARDALEQLDDDDLDASLIHVGKEHRSEDPFTTGSFVTTGDFSSSAQRFRVLRPHAAGGLGKVSVAHDEELSREVALKEIKEKYADSLDNRSRFIVEAEITGGLEHPGIVPVYGLGQYADGRPFYAMRFIRGDSLKQAITHHHKQDSARQNLGQRSLDLCKLLRRFIDVCYAIEYAHSRGVLHRDLKPGNIMLGKYGETLVVDWGLAKTTQDANEKNLHEPPLRPASASGSAATQAGSQLGTPAYMSPEQAAGRLDLLNTSSDVYSLGATLYELLTGEAPFAGRRIEDLLTNVKKGDFPKPRSRKQGIPPALEAIVLKAMALQQADRYPSAATLAEDVESWLADEPVTAWEEPFSVRANRWMRRHRTWVSSAAAALVAAVAILSMSMVLVLAAKNEAVHQKQRALAAKSEADHQKQRAEDNLQVAMQAVHEMLTQVGSEDLADVPQMEELRTRLLAKAKEFYEQLGKHEPTDRRLRFEIALASQGIGDVHRIAGEMQLATAKYEDAIARLEKLRQEFPNESEYQRQLANAFNFLGVSLKPTNRERAILAYDEAKRFQEDLLDRSPGDPNVSLELARSIYNRGIARSESGDYKNGEDDYHLAIDQLNTLISEEKGPETHLDACRQELARCYNNLAILLKTNGQNDEAKGMYEKAIETLTPVQERDAKSREYMKELATYHNNFANFLEKLEDFEAARTQNDEALRLLEELAKAVPKVRDELGNTLNTQAAVIGRLSKGAEGSVSARRSEELFRQLFEERPNDLLYQHRLGNALYTRAILKYRQEDFLAAKTLLAESLAHHVLVLTETPDDLGFLPNFDNDCFMLALVLKKLNQPDEELKELEKAKTARPLQIPKALLYAARLLGEAARDAESDNNVNESSSETTANRLAELTLILLETAARSGQISLQQLSEGTDEGGALFHVKDRDGFSRIKALLENDRKVVPQK